MSSNKKHFSLGWAVGIFLGLASSGSAVYAGQVTNPTFTGGETLTAAHMNNIKDAVNDNDTGKGTCTGNPAETGDTMVRVGSICVDKYEAFINSSVARSVAGDTPSGATWAAAADACAQAGKRLPTNAEWQTAAAGTDPANCNVVGGGGTLAANNANLTCTSSFAVVNMAGNIAEWVADWSGDGTGGTGGGVATTTSALTQARGIVRGGDATDASASLNWLRAGMDLGTATQSGNSIANGFRCVR